jgi:hypothetical protein
MSHCLLISILQAYSISIPLGGIMKSPRKFVLPPGGIVYSLRSYVVMLMKSSRVNSMCTPTII